MKKKFEKKYEVTYRDVDTRGECRITSFMDFMADCGLSQDAYYGYDIYDLCKNDYTWMLVDYEIKIHKPSKYKDIVKVITYIDGMNKFYALRCFEIYNEKGEMLLEAKTLVILVDTIKRRPMSISEKHYEVYGLKERDSSIGKNKIKLKSCIIPQYEKKMDIRYSDLDLNSHVGNVKYIELVLETIPLDIMKRYRVDLIYIKYNKELIYNEEIKVETEIKNEEKQVIANHEIINEKGESVSLLQTYWREMEKYED